MKMKMLLLMLVLGTVGCGRQEAERWSEQVASQHDQIDGLLDRGDDQQARQLLTAILDDIPATHPQRRVLLQDARFRLARLALTRGDLPTALQQADAGLALGDHGDLFTANLLIVRGAAREGVPDAAGAAADYERALAINESLLHGVLPSP